MCEQVSPHPPVSAFHAESRTFRFHGSIHPKIKFWGKSVEIQPKGVVTVQLLESVAGAYLVTSIGRFFFITVFFRFFRFSVSVFFCSKRVSRRVCQLKSSFRSGFTEFYLVLPDGPPFWKSQWPALLSDIYRSFFHNRLFFDSFGARFLFFCSKRVSRRVFRSVLPGFTEFYLVLPDGPPFWKSQWPALLVTSIGRFSSKLSLFCRVLFSFLHFLFSSKRVSRRVNRLETKFSPVFTEFYRVLPDGRPFFFQPSTSRWSMFVSLVMEWVFFCFTLRMASDSFLEVERDVHVVQRQLLRPQHHRRQTVDRTVRNHGDRQPPDR